MAFHLFISFVSFLFEVTDGCDLPCHPVGKLNNVIFCPWSLVIVSEITLQPERERKERDKEWKADILIGEKHSEPFSVWCGEDTERKYSCENKIKRKSPVWHWTLHSAYLFAFYFKNLIIRAKGKNYNRGKTELNPICQSTENVLETQAEHYYFDRYCDTSNDFSENDYFCIIFSLKKYESDYVCCHLWTNNNVLLHLEEDDL